MGYLCSVLFFRFDTDKVFVIAIDDVFFSIVSLSYGHLSFQT